uniref:Uncharacterized protein n=1 Tax=Rhizophora mucronata TaxID=61149 RepID=A0A2P2MKE4_RHIMU
MGAGSQTVEIDYLPIVAGRTLKVSIFGGLKTKSDLPTMLEKFKNKVCFIFTQLHSLNSIVSLH